MAQTLIAVRAPKLVIAAGAALAIAVPLVAVPGGSVALGYQRPATIQRVSLASGGHQFKNASGGGGSGDTDGGVAISPNGRFVAFTNATPVAVAPGDLGAVNTVFDVYLRDRLLGRTVKVSVARDGGDAVGLPTCDGASEPAVSADGRYVAFSSCYSNLTDQPTPVGGTPAEPVAFTQVYVRDMRAGVTTLASVGVGGLPAATGARSPTISDDGNRVAFFSTSNLTGTDAPCEQPVDPSCFARNLAFVNDRVWVRDLRTRTTMLGSVGSNGVPADGGSDDPSISPDGRYVLFISTAGNLSAVDNDVCTDQAVSLPTCPDTYLHDFKTGRTELISIGLDGKAASAQPYYRTQMISRDDRYVAFQSTGRNIVPADVLGGFGYYVRDRHTGRTERADVDSMGRPLGTGDTTWSLSENGRYFAVSNNPGSNCDAAPIAFHDLVTGATSGIGYTVSQSAYCKNPTGAASPHLSTDGRYVEFTSAGKLTPDDTNKVGDVFVQDRGTALGTNGIKVASGSRAASAPLLSRTDAFGDTDSAWSALGGDLVAATVAYRPSNDDVFVRLAVAHMTAPSLLSPIRYGFRFAIDGTAYTATARCTGPNGDAVLRLADADGVSRGAFPAYCGTTGEEVVWSIPRTALTSRRGDVLRPIDAFTGLMDERSAERDTLSF